MKAPADPTERGLRRAALTDAGSRAVYADWLEERGDPRAAFWRHAASRGLEPAEWPEGATAESGEMVYLSRFAWNRPNLEMLVRDSPSTLPEDVWRELKRHRHAGRYWRFYSSRVRAWNDAERAWLAARGAGEGK